MIRIFIPLILGIATTPEISNSTENGISQLNSIAIFDAGSTGTRLNLYKFNGDKVISVSNFTEPLGIDSLTRESAKLALQSLIDQSNIDKSTPIAFYGTAGLRSVSHRKRNSILEIVRETLKEYNLREATVISGNDESIYVLRAFESLNLTNNNFGLIDMGGKSVQLITKENDQVNVLSLDLGILKSKCTEIQNINTEPYNCINKLLSVSGLSQIESFKEDSEIILLSSFYDILYEYGELNTIENLSYIFSNTCNGTITTKCRQFYYIIEFLRNLKLDPNQQLHIVRFVNGFDLTWSLGKAIELNRIQQNKD